MEPNVQAIREFLERNRISVNTRYEEKASEGTWLLVYRSTFSRKIPGPSGDCDLRIMYEHYTINTEPEVPAPTPEEVMVGIALAVKFALSGELSPSDAGYDQAVKSANGMVMLMGRPLFNELMVLVNGSPEAVA